MYVLCIDESGCAKIFYTRVKIGVTRHNLRLKDIILTEVDESEYFKTVSPMFDKCVNEGKTKKELRSVLIKTCGMSESLADYYLEKYKVLTGELSC